MIPKIIHWCWLSDDPYPPKVRQCIASWHKVLPDYEIILWDKNRFPLNSNTWVKEAFYAKKYAFAADYIRLYAIYNYGGIYLDSDVEVLKPFDDLLELPYFIGGESYSNREEIAAFGAEKGTTWVKQCLDHYEGRHFVHKNGLFDITALPDIAHSIITSLYQIHRINSINDFAIEKIKEGHFYLFPNDWFCANIHPNEENEKEMVFIVSSHTYCIHHFLNSWLIPAYKETWAKKLIRTILMPLGIYQALFFFKRHLLYKKIQKK
jgi:hypothetical protein